jgi:enoyl-CoA hydratase/carnithine racemase
MVEKFGNIIVDYAGHVAIIEIQRPPNNHVSIALVRDLADALTTIDVNDAIRCSVLQTEGRNFCAGADFAMPSDVAAPSVEAIRQLYVEAVRLYSARKPIVALVQGAAIGAGLGLALVADFRIASPDAEFSANFAKFGLHPGFGITYTLPRIVGKQKALYMCLSGRRVGATEAFAWQLVDEVVPLESLRSAGLKLAQEIAENAPLALLAVRSTLRGDLASAVKAQTDRESFEQLKLRSTQDFDEGIRAARESRSAHFSGR